MAAAFDAGVHPSGLVAPLQSSTQTMPGARRDFVECLHRAEEADSPYEAAAQAARPAAETDSLMKNNFLRAAECVASLHEVDVVLDLFLGSGYSAAALAYGLMAKQPQRPSARPPEVISFEINEDVVHDAFRPDGAIGAGGKLGWWQPMVVNHSTGMGGQLAFEAKLAQHLNRWGTFNTASSHSQGRPRVLAIMAEPYPKQSRQAGGSYKFNALDMVCQQRAPTAVLIDTSLWSSIEAEWMIIEAVCRPRWVLIFNTNLHSGSGWIAHRLDLLSDWHLEARGHVAMWNKPWPLLAEVRRVRAWTVYSRRLHSNDS